MPTFTLQGLYTLPWTKKTKDLLDELFVADIYPNPEGEQDMIAAVQRDGAEFTVNDTRAIMELWRNTCRRANYSMINHMDCEPRMKRWLRTIVDNCIANAPASSQECLLLSPVDLTAFIVEEIPFDPVPREVQFQVQLTSGVQTNQPGEVIKRYTDGDDGGVYTFIESTDWIEPQDNWVLDDESNYEIRVSENSMGPWPPTMAGDALDTWLPMTSARSWSTTGVWDSQTGWNPNRVDVLVEIRKISDPISCYTSFVVRLDPGDIG